ncbi:MAG: hypothetical protein ACRD0M_00890 [Acidimicrobiales bacterium]
MTEGISITTTEPTDHFRLEYDTERDEVRLTAGATTTVMPRSAFTAQLGLPPVAAAGGGRRYLLFAGFHRYPDGGARDFVAAFPTEDAAQEGFRRLRVQQSDSEEWADLVALEDSGGLTRLSWFGLLRPPHTRRAGRWFPRDAGEAGPPAGDDHRWRVRRWARVVGHPSGLGIGEFAGPAA